MILKQSQSLGMHVWRTDGFPKPYWDRVILFDGAYDSMRRLACSSFMYRA